MTWYICDLYFTLAWARHHGLGIGAQVAPGVSMGHFGLLGRALLRDLQADRVPQAVVVGWCVHGAPWESARGWC